MTDPLDGFDIVSEEVRVIEVARPDNVKSMFEISVYRQLRPQSESPVFYARCLKVGGDPVMGVTTFPVIFGDSEVAVLNASLEHLRTFEFPPGDEPGPPYRPGR